MAHAIRMRIPILVNFRRMLNHPLQRVHVYVLSDEYRANAHYADASPGRHSSGTRGRKERTRKFPAPRAPSSHADATNFLTRTPSRMLCTSAAFPDYVIS